MRRWTELSMLLFLITAAGFLSPAARPQDNAAPPIPRQDNARQVDNGGWITLFDGKNLDNWHAIGNANWKLLDGAVQADQGSGFLVSNKSYSDFQVRAEFWVDADANSGVFLRCSDPQHVTSANAYEVNIYDKNLEYGTGAIVDLVKPSTNLKAAGRWNTYEITAKGPHFTIILNGAKTAELDDTKHPQGPIALQYSAGLVKFRSVQIKPLTNTP